jgi:cytochrome c oxidase subunit 2
MQRGPILEGLPAWYVELQLKKFSSGVRGRNPDNKSEALMGLGSAQVHDPEERRRVAAHIASRPPPPHLLTVRGDRERGRELYQACAPCHGERGEGRPELKGPPLNTLEDWYQMDQLRKFKSGLRGRDPRDVEGLAMGAALTAQGEQEFRDVTRFIAEELAAGAAVPRSGAAKPN